MALIKFGGGVVQMSGSIAGTTFARNRYGNYARAKTKPINPNTALQQQCRNALSFLTTYWAQTLSDAQRVAWNLYGSSVAMTNRLGESVFLTGFNHFIRSNSIRKRSSRPIIAPGPTIFELPEVDSTITISASAATNHITIAYDDTMDWLDEDNAWLTMFCGQPQNAQRNFFAGPWKLWHTIAGNSVAPPVTPEDANSPFVLTEGQHVWVYGRIARADGRLSIPFRDDCLVGA